MNVIVCDTARQAQHLVAERIIVALRARQALVLGLATGGTMRPVYDALVEAYRAGRVSFKTATTFNLDEYLAMSPDHPASYHAFMRAALFDRVDIDPSKTHLPLGDCIDPTMEADRYENLIRAVGGIDLQLLGLGFNGHIGFNEPGSSLWSRTRLVTLATTTREANARYFKTPEETPRQAITMGIATIMDARHGLLLATGAQKASIVKRMIEGPVHPDCPASVLQGHPATTVVLDRAAAADLEGQTDRATHPARGEHHHGP